MAAPTPSAATGSGSKANPYVKTVTASNPPKVKKEKPAARTSTPAELAAKEALRAEVLALGGDDAELKMLLDVDSDSEVEGEEEVVVGKKDKAKKGKAEGGVDAALSKDLRSLFKSLNFPTGGAGAAALSDEDDDAAVVDDEEDDASDDESGESEESSDDEEEIITPAVPVVVKTKTKAEKVEKVEQKESKYEREERRKAEREVEKAKDKAERAAVREEKAIPKPIITKSPWIIDPTPQWYSVELPTLVPTTTRTSPALLATLQAQGATLLARENTLYSTSLAPRAPSSAPPAPNGLSKADQVFIQQILTSGTSSDKISALLLLVSSSPLHTTAYLEQLAGLCKKKSREESGRAVRGVVDWWRGGGGDGGGSPSRKLRAFADQPGLSAVGNAWEKLEKFGKGREQSAKEAGLSRAEVEQFLTVWAFEDWLKKWFFQVLQALEQMSVDPLPHPRTLAVVHLSNLLRDKPEQEGNILRLLVNKLGDSQRNIASKTSHHLLQILQFHPGMTPILVREVSALVLRPALAALPTAGGHVRFGKDAAKEKAKDNGQDHARYYGVITLNQVMLTKHQADVAGKMIEVYFEIFGDILGRVAEEEAAAEGELVDGAKPVVVRPKFVKGKGGKGAKGDKDEGGEGEVNETDSKLVAAVLTGVNRAFPFAKIDDEAFKARLDTLFRITHTGTFNVSIQALMLIYHVSAAKRAVSDRFYRALYASLFDPRLAGSSKQALYLNLVFKAMKQDTDPKRVMAHIKRLVQVMLGMEVTFILGSIWIVGELTATIPGLRKMVTEPEDAAAMLAQATDAPSSSHHDDGRYDGKKREPQYANAQNSCLWEVVPLLNHFHPSVVLHAEQLLNGEPISASTDLEQHSLNHFLDRFVYREVKKSIPTKGSSMMQSGVSGQDRTGRIVMKKGPARGDESLVNSDLFKNKVVGDVPVDQRFFHTYFSAKTAQVDEKTKANKKRKNRKGNESSDDDSIADLGFSDAGDDDEDLPTMPADDDDEEDSAAEEEIWKAMKASMPKRAADDAESMDDDMDDDDDEDMAEFDYSDSDDEGEAGAEKPFKSAFEDDESPFDDDDDDGDNLMEDEGDLIGSDEDMPMFAQGGSDGEDEPVAKKGSKEERKQKKRKLKHLPMFATADDYAHLMGDSDED